MDALFTAALTGSAIAGLWDMKTTEVPDELPVVMSAFGLFYWFAVSLFSESMAPFALSLLSGLAFLVPGLLLYHAGKWGEADAWVPASILFMVPAIGGTPMLPNYVINFCIVSSAYMIIYSLALGVMNPKVFSLLIKDVMQSREFHLVLLVTAACFALVYAMSGVSYALISLSAILLLALFWRYALVIEQNVFRKEINVAQLREGDVLDAMVWRGLTKDEIADIKKSRKKVMIKEGVRFVPVYAIALAVTAVYGNILIWMLTGAII